MKTRKLIAPVLVLLIFAGSFQVFAQNGNRDGNGNGNGNRDGRNNRNGDRLACLDLTAEQETQAKAIFTGIMEQTTPIKADVKVKQAELDQLMIADSPNEKAIYAKVDEISQLRTEMQKLRIEGKLKVRAILDDDQKSKFDANQVDGKRAEKGKPQGQKSSKGQRADCRR
ncbi:Spy/CpxP family protein refolding chaperone [Lentimicrobium sp. S6]|uniref:Spy/CpxP family protein refolding chaperone n=1 Tax=Lentimicrobium sp. S6 TaxID=2735872 RepID=UPI0015572B89|nr:Spy/CpxP family protein refolding chaperone [Lentimicrobium sp. S6]NPD44512.1 Spy/CpxP family protein refolding chaperone [Lentimicrobium sp. S6]